LLRPKFGLSIFLDQISVARSSSDLSRVLDRIWVLALRLVGRLAELDLAQCIGLFDTDEIVTAIKCIRIE